LTSLLSFLSSSHIVASERILVNTSFPFNINTNTDSQESFTGMVINMEVNTSRDQSISLSTNSSRVTSVHSNVFSIAYAECVQALANNLIWADQVKLSEFQELALSYTIPKVGEKKYANQVKVTEPILDPHNVVNNDTCLSQGLELMVINKICSPQDLESLVISYLANQSVNS